MFPYLILLMDLKTSLPASPAPNIRIFFLVAFDACFSINSDNNLSLYFILITIVGTSFISMELNA